MPLAAFLLLLLAAHCAAIDFDSFFGGPGGFAQQQAGAGAGGAGAGGAKDTEYYDRLGVEPGCGEDEIKRGYKKRSLRAHPDRGGSEEEFKLLNEAYQILSDPQKRAAYDQGGKAAVDGSAPGAGAGGMGGGFPGGFSGGFPGGFPGGMGGGVDMESLFNQFFRQQQQQRVHVVQARPARAAAAQPQPRPQPSRMRTHVTLSTATPPRSRSAWRSSTRVRPRRTSSPSGG